MRCPVSPRRALCAAALCAAWLLCGAAEAAACSCLTVRPCQAFADADAVFVGTVAAQTEREQPEKPGTPGSYASRVQVSKFHVEEVFAGLAGAREVEIETDLGTSCDFRLRLGTRYVVYAHRVEGAEAKSPAPEILKTNARGRFSFTAYEGTAYLVGAQTADCVGPECLHAHDVLVGPTGTPRPLRLVLDQPGVSCERCRDYDEFQEGKR